MKHITKKEYKKIKSLEKKFYDGVDKYCETLEDTWSFLQHFEAIIEIIDEAMEVDNK